MPLTAGGRARGSTSPATRPTALGSTALVALALAACDRRSPDRTRPAATTGATAVTTASASAPPRASSSSSAPAPASGAPASASASAGAEVPSFEVEFSGQLRGGPAAERHVVLVTPVPCTVDNAATVATIAIGEGRTRAGARRYWTEGNVREGSAGYVCALALDRDGRLVGFGAYARNPLRLVAHGKAEAELEDIDVALSPVSPPRPLPADRY